MSTWKKVALDEKILAAVGGGNQTDILGGGTGNAKEVIVSAASGGAGNVSLENNNLLAGDGSAAVAVTIGSSGGDVSGAVNGTDLELSLKNDSVGTAELADDSVNIDRIAHGFGTDSFGGTNVDIRGGILYWKDGAADTDASSAGIQTSADNGHPDIAIPDTAGQVLTAQLSGGNLNPVWAAPAGAGTITINNGDGASAAVPVLFGSNTSVGGLTAQTVNEDAGFKWDPGASFHHGNVTAGVISDSGFKGNLAGTATNSTKVKTTVAANSTPHYLLMATNSSATGAENVKTQSIISCTPNSTPANSSTSITGSLSVSGDLTVSGTTTTINTTELDIEDTEIQIANKTTFADNGVFSEDVQTGAGSLGVGLIIFNGQGNGLAAAEGVDAVAATAFENDNAKKARLMYHGHKGSSTYTSSASVLGWSIAQETSNGTPNTNQDGALSNATSFGIGVMHINATSLSTSGGAAALDIGVGAMSLDSDGNLWVQTAVTA